jgi:nucleoside triphosphate diphosphatase
MNNPETQTIRYAMADLVYLMARLRNPDTGCPWDVKQTFASIVPSTLEEVYEVVDAIEKKDNTNLLEELGDLLFQVVFYGQMASEAHLFNFDDITHNIVEKLLRRHPHVFPSGQLYDHDISRRNIDDKTLLEQWERIKSEEKLGKQTASAAQRVLDVIPVAMPALQRSYKIQKKLAAVGFDWKSAEELFPVVESEWREVQEAVASGIQDSVEDEIGDMLFAMVNLARHYKVDPESALRRSNRKVERRFAYIEDQLMLQGKTPAQASMDDMEMLWQQAKKTI